MNFENEIKILEEEIDLLIESSINRVVARIIKNYKDNNISIGKKIIDNKINTTLACSLYGINKETCEKYNYFLKNIYKLLKDKIKNNNLSKIEIKNIISKILKQIDKTKHPLLTISLFDNFKESMQTMSEVYDNDKLNKSLEILFKKDFNDILSTINETNKEFLDNQIKQVIIKIIKS